MSIFIYISITSFEGFCSSSDSKESTCKAGDLGSIPRSGRSPGEGNSNPLQCSCLENPRDGGAWWAAVYGVAQSWTRLSDLAAAAAAIKNLPASVGDAGDSGLIPGSARCFGGGNGNPHQYFCLENSMDRGAWRATVYRAAKGQMRLSD